MRILYKYDNHNNCKYVIDTETHTMSKLFNCYEHLIHINAIINEHDTGTFFERKDRKACLFVAETEFVVFFNGYLFRTERSYGKLRSFFTYKNKFVLYCDDSELMFMSNGICNVRQKYENIEQQTKVLGIEYTYIQYRKEILLN